MFLNRFSAYRNVILLFEETRNFFVAVGFVFILGVDNFSNDVGYVRACYVAGDRFWEKRFERNRSSGGRHPLIVACA